MIRKAVFKKVNGKISLLCSECNVVIKTEEIFNTVEEYALAGITTLLARYCDEHKDMHSIGESKKQIKNKLREYIMKKNVLGINITKPNQELVIIRGVPGSGKSTKAKTLVGEGVIHSTDDLIEATGDYNGYFAKMIKSGNWSEHGKMHNKNFLNAKKSMVEGVKRVVIDNTNIKPSEAKKYVVEALKLGLDESNIKIVDVGDGGQTPEVLAERNTHNVPLKTIKRMLNSHRSIGELTVNKILEAKGSVRTERVLYSAVVLNQTDRSQLLANIGDVIPDGWRVVAHHMTIVFGKGIDDKSQLGKEVTLTATHIGKSDKAIAVMVDGFPSNNKIAHITLAVNVDGGGKPFHSNNITDWEELSRKILVKGIVTDIKAS